jgi:uncharacterized phage protein (TIGR02220 family)
MARADNRSVQHFTELALIAYLEPKEISNPVPVLEVPQALPAVAKKAKADKGSFETDKAERVIDYLNSKAGTKYRYAKPNIKLILDRLNENNTVLDCCTVVDKKCAEWIGTDFQKHLKPGTLFCAKHFDNYLNQIDSKPKSFSERAQELQGGFLTDDGTVLEGEVIYEPTKNPALAGYAEPFEQPGGVLPAERTII